MDPFFLDGGAGPVFCLYHPPAAGVTPRGGLLYLPPFAEEMNRSRAMAAMLARALAADGIGTLILDPHGTGDSAGDFADGRWTIWRDDAAAALDWLADQTGGPCAVLGLRLGALMTLSLQSVHESGPARLILWQPVLNGNQFLTQFLRIRMAAGLTGDSSAAGGETTKDLRARLDAGETVEVAGYDLTPGLAADLDGLKLADFDPRPAPVHWFEVVGEDGREAPPAARKQAEAWQAAGVDVTLETVTGEPFWSLQETTTAPALIEATRQVLS